MSFEGKVYAITGAASGIGLSIAKHLHARGAKISLADISEKGLQEAANSIGSEDKILTSVCDVRNLEHVKSWIQNTIDKFGKLDGAANFAGVLASQNGKIIEDQDEEDWERVLGINLTGVMHCLKVQLPHLKPGSSIVNASSIAGIRGLPGLAAYGASKHGVAGLTKICASDYASKRIRINAVAPGTVETPMSAAFVGKNEGYDQWFKSVVPMGRKAQPDELAKVTLFLLGEESSYVTGQVWSVDGGWSGM
ncbi:Hypothetical predicted protein [Lecanosticta acicola]|uniref:Ketoreductase domain-containing protein n=1 Tax=Lecanosticta acicola TaxID=111012 RepID=A0AAI9E8E9_9PEZI|nr:Hypothetical predicted protein [Lecanosticta acicola]